MQMDRCTFAQRQTQRDSRGGGGGGENQSHSVFLCRSSKTALLDCHCEMTERKKEFDKRDIAGEVRQFFASICPSSSSST